MDFTEDIFQQFQSFLIEQAGLYFRKDAGRSLGETLAERVAHCQLNSYEDYLHYLKFHSQRQPEFQTLLNLLTIGETYFFRNEPQFGVLVNYVLPQLVEKKNEIQELRIWCAGCSTGEEPYTIAIILKEMFPRLMRWNLSILATDINSQVLKAATEGVYSPRSVKYVPEAYSNHYFTKRGPRYALADEIKKMVRFEYHNLATDPYALLGMQGVDILFCRNVTIYFDRKTVQRVIAQFSDCLNPDSYFLIGHAETLWGISDEFATIEFPQTFLYQKSEERKQEKAVCHIPIPPVMSPAPDSKEIATLPEPSSQDSNTRTPCNDKETHNEFKKATILANHGDYEEAMKILKTLIAKDNLHTPAYYLLGVLYSKKEQYPKAIEEFRRALYIDEKLAVGYYHLGNIYHLVGNATQAKKEYNNCLRLLKQKKDEAEAVPFSEGLTVGVLLRAAERAMECL